MSNPIRVRKTKRNLPHLWAPTIDIEGPAPINEPIELFEIEDVLRELDLPNQERDY